MQLTEVPASGDGVALAVHGGAGTRLLSLTEQSERAYRAGLERALSAGRNALRAGAPALDAVCAAVVELENDELFNAGRGAALTAAGTAELDAAVMIDGAAGAVASCRDIRNPVLAARAVMEHTEHVLLVSPRAELVDHWGLERVPNDYFVTDRRRAELTTFLRDAAPGTRHGTVGAVARDATGHLAAATSTGGVTGQLAGRVGDVPVIGAGTWADDATAAISCTGHGEYFLRGVVAYDVSAQLAYRGATLAAAVRETIARTLDARGGLGGLISVARDGQLVLAYNTESMPRGWLTGDELVTVA